MWGKEKSHFSCCFRRLWQNMRRRRMKMRKRQENYCDRHWNAPHWSVIAIAVLDLPLPAVPSSPLSPRPSCCNWPRPVGAIVVADLSGTHNKDRKRGP